ncbi:antirestriction protein ArdA [Parvularcula flava]|uniref:Antirestriction protein ArdA n=1 Tax=Aquisalinus luteolus TaxID=1566827 RepID=A0A8J3A6L5_9PROT|nr:antirestriction protein ArdA [Aquisalinus luteolus]NHK29681.1 antirestriction protein ArdA [Aquisalinus luteolus]GGI02124.1 hypothetical protein GCM10011355_34380 [Aquisalinus luteolus]
MSITLFAQPYDLAANGFYFSSADEFSEKAATLRNDHGQKVEEFEIQFIDGEAIDAAFAEAWGLSQGTLARFFELAGEWDEQEKQRFIIAVSEVGYSFDPDSIGSEDFEIDIYHLGSLKELAEEFIAEGLFGEIPDHLTNYIDIDAITRDLSFDYTETDIAGTRLIYRAN